MERVITDLVCSSMCPVNSFIDVSLIMVENGKRFWDMGIFHYNSKSDHRTELGARLSVAVTFQPFLIAGLHMQTFRHAPFDVLGKHRGGWCM